MPQPDSQRELPAAFDAQVLERNLAALDRADPGLAARIRLPVDSSSVAFESGRACLVLHRQHARLELEPRELERARGASRAVVIGIGMGEMVQALLSSGEPRVVAWERDPWILRLFLMRCDVADALARGSLRLALGTDLLSLATAGATVLEHPLLGPLYANEARLLRGATGTRRAVLCAGGLFVDALGRALRARGYDLWTLDVRRLAAEELSLAMSAFRPELVASINYVDGLAEFCASHGARLLCWEIDPTTAPPRLTPGAEGACVFTYRRAHVAELRRAGFSHVEFLPLAADPETRAPLELTEDERERYGAPVAFVGSSMVESALEHRARFVEAWCRWRDGAPGARGEGETLLDELLAAQRASSSRPVLDQLLRERAPGFVEQVPEDPRWEDPRILAGEIAASERRLTFAASLGDDGLHVWGDEGWRQLESRGVRYRGPAGHRHELTRIYNAVPVHVDLGRLFQRDIVTMRVFDVLACGSLVVAEHGDELEALFDVGSEVESFRDLSELRAKVAYYASHPDLARDIGLRGRDAIVERHSIQRRVDHMLAVVSR